MEGRIIETTEIQRQCIRDICSPQITITTASCEMYPQTEGLILTAVKESDQHRELAISEAGLLIASLRGSLPAVPPDTNWQALTIMAETHGALLLVQRAFIDIGVDISDSTFQRAVLDCRLSAEKLAAELEMLLAAFAQHNIDVIPLKGPVLAEALYGSATLRSSDDLDLLVRASDLSRAEEVLANTGWVAPSPPDEFERQFFRNDTLVELHFGVTSAHSFPFDLDGAWSRTQNSSFRGQPIKVMSEVDRAFYLLIHGLRHGFGKLIWILDAARSIGIMQECTVREFVEQARARGLQQALHIGCALILEVFPEKLPEALKDVLAESPNMMKAGQALAAALLAGEAGIGRMSEISFYLQTQTERAKRWQCRLTFFSPTGQDYLWAARYRLPPIFAVFIRPFRILAKYGLKRAWHTAFPPPAPEDHIEQSSSQ